MEVRIKRPDGTSFNSYLLPTDTVEHLRELISLRFQLEKRESENLKILRTSSLANGSMEENGIQNGSTVIVDFPGTESGKCSDPFHDAIYSVDPRKLTDRATIPVDKGGVGLLNDGSAFHVEKDSTDKAKELSMSIASPAAAKSYKDHDDIDGGEIKQLYTLEPHGTTFTKPVWVALPYDPKIPVERLGVFYIQSNPDGSPHNTWKYIPISRFDGAKAIVSITHFSGIGVFEFADVAKQRTATLMRTDNKWEAVTPGLIYRGTCKNPACPVTGKVVNCARGFGTFNLATDLIDYALCPMCNQSFDPDKFVLFDTEAVVKWMKEDKTKGDDPYSVSNSEVRAFGIDSYGSTGSAKYRSFVIQTKPGKSTSFFIDVCFGLDCTGSMGPYIAAGQAQIIKIAQGLETELKAKSLSSQLRVSFVGYRDYNADGSKPADILDIVPFTKDIPTLVARVSAQKATGGADTPEHIVGAFKSATDLDWQGSTRVFVLIGDAPCHGREYHDKDETFPAGDPSGLTPPPFLEQMITKNIHFFFMRINNSTDKMIEKFRANYDNSVNNSKDMKIEVMDLGSDPNIMGKLVLDGVMKKINDLYI